MAKKGIYYSMDALLAGFLLVGVAATLLTLSYYEPTIDEKTFTTQDLLNVLNAIRVSDVNHPFITTEIANGNISDASNTILEQIGEYWALNETAKATQLFSIITNQSLPPDINIQFSIESEEIFLQNDSTITNLAVSRRMISGIAKGAPISGSSSSAYLKKVRNKKTSSYAYLGGFIGQGNITFYLDDVPSDIAGDKIIGMHFEGDVGGNFTFYINGIQCGGDYFPNSVSGQIDYWNLNACNASIVSGRNVLQLNFTSTIDFNYVAGGLFEIQYRTDELQQNIGYGQDTYHFPGIQGVANVYDSFYIPGTLTTMDIALHFNSSQYTYISVGERVIEINSTGTDQWTYLTNDDLLNTYAFDYDQLSVNTVPLRFAAYNVSVQEIVYGNADVVLITDFSGSMKKAIDSWTQGNAQGDCEDILNYPDARKTYLARCLDVDFINVLMNTSGNRIWPVFMHADDISYYNNPDDEEAVSGYVSTFGPQGKDKTCLSCAINQAYDILSTYSNDSRTKAILLMTDGAPTHCADDGCAGTGTDYGSLICDGYCDTNGASGCNPTEKVGCDIADLSCEPAEQNTLLSAQRAVDDLNASFFTVGFGLIEECSRAELLLQDIADMNNGSYFHSKNTTELQLIYYNISQQILSRVEQVNQSVFVRGNITEANLYPDSHINFTYTPLLGPVDPGKISLVLKEPLTTCTSVVDIPSGVQIVDSKVVSYSGTSWSDVVVVNGYTVFNLSDYYVPYYKLGDPLVIQIPTTNITEGNNTIFIDTGSSLTNRSGCSQNNSFIYTALINASTPRTQTFEINDGCNWTVESEAGTFSNILIPNDYAGSKICNYTATDIQYNPYDAYDSATYHLLRQLDPDNDGRVIVDLTESDLEITITLVSGVPYLWGPSMVQMSVWE